MKASIAETSPFVFQGDITVKKTPEIINAGIVVYIMFLMWSKRSIPTMLAAIPVVSDSGDILSPKKAPDTTAPAVIAGFRSNTPDRPMSATPRVATVVKLLPIEIPIIAVMQKAER